jgi:hypothetical protein
MLKTAHLLFAASKPVMNAAGRILPAASLIFSTLISERPFRASHVSEKQMSLQMMLGGTLILHRVFLVAMKEKNGQPVVPTRLFHVLTLLNTLNGSYTSGFELCDILSGDTLLLQLVNVDEEWLRLCGQGKRA